MSDCEAWRLVALLLGIGGMLVLAGFVTFNEWSHRTQVKRWERDE